VSGGESGGGARIVWSRGGEAVVVSITAGGIVLRSTVPSPPGSRIEGVLQGDAPASVRVKVHASRRQPEGDYLLEGRPLDMARETRERVERLAKGV
jgi:hypothetical protein